MHPLDSLEPNPVPPHAGPEWATLPPVCADQLGRLRARGLAPRDQLLLMAKAGSAPEILAATVARLYCPERCWSDPRTGSVMIGELGDGERLAASSWAVSILDQPDQVVAVLGASLLDVFAYRLANLPPARWLDGPIHFGLEPELILAATEGGLLFLSPIHPLNLNWMQKVGGYLQVLDPIWPVQLPPVIQCENRLHLRGVRGLATPIHPVVHGAGGIAIFEDCPDLQVIEVPQVTRLEVWNCPALHRITGQLPVGGINVVGCPNLDQTLDSDWEVR